MNSNYNFNKRNLLFLLLVFLVTSFSYAQEITSVNHPEWSYNKVIYEVNLRQYTEEGTFKAFEEHLPRLKEMGVRILWFMPIHPIGELNRKGTLGSYYSVKDYKAVNPEHGTLEDFKSLIKKIHEMDMYVILDWVANHTAWDNVWVYEHPEFYTKDENGNFIPPVADWSDVIDLNYDNKELWDYMIDAMKFWVEEADIDGYRCDVAGMVPLEFWQRVRRVLDEIKPVFMLAEAWETELHSSFDMTYSWDIHHMFTDIASGKKNAGDLRLRLWEEEQMYPKEAFRMQFTSNHDENTWKGTVFERLGDGAEAFAALTFVIPGMPLIYGGQEAGLDKRLEFFEKDPIEWKEHEFKELYTTLCKLKNENDALLSGELGGKIKYIQPSYYGDPAIIPPQSIIAFEREGNKDKIFAIFNLSDKEENVPVSWYLTDKNYINIFTFDIIESEEFILKPWDYRIFYKN
jgi:cyclomaltodextrinase / maltogenic alpha-amylase / neopullulanase